MDFSTRKTLFAFVTLILAMMVCETSNGEVFQLGWSYGAPNDLHYDTWGPSNNFHVGDIIVINYSPDYDGVAQVTRENFETCNYTNPIAIWTDTLDCVIPITKHGHFYYISDEPGHCKDGQKFVVYVPETQGDGPHQLGPSADAPDAPNTVNTLAPSPNGPSPSTPNAPTSTSSSSNAGLSSLYFLFQRSGH